MKSITRVTAASAVLLLAACGGGGGSGAAATGGSVSGTSYKGPTAGATVCAYAFDGNAVGKKGAKVSAQAGSTPAVSNGCVVTANDGTYTLALPAGAPSPLLLESTGGTYCSNETVFDGTACPGGGTPVALGSASLRTVVTAPASGAVAGSPLTLLTTAAADSASAVDAGSFNSAYATVAANFGLGGTTPSTSPSSGALQTALAGLASYLNGDAALIQALTASIADGGTTSASIDPNVAADMACAALSPTDATVNMAGGGSYQLAGFVGCVDAADHQSHTQVSYFVDSGLGTLLGNMGQAYSGTYAEDRYAGSCGDVDPFATFLGNASTTMTARYDGTAALPRSASADTSVSQQGTASKLTFVLDPSAGLGLAQASTRQQLFCRLAPTATDQPFTGAFGSLSSPLNNGYPTRIDGRARYTGGSPP